jgi:hypothetical protein
VEGAEHLSTRGVFICNHASPLDIFLVMWLAPTGTVEIAKKEVRAQDRTLLLTLPALIFLYIHLLYILIIKIPYFIYNSSALIHTLYHYLSTVGSTYHFI